jgi:broad specificity phosphatase PhoE
MSDVTRWWWIRHAPVPDGGRIYGQGDVDCDCGDAEIFRILARELPRNAVWVTSNLVRTKQTAEAILASDEGKRLSDVQLRAIPEFAEQHLGEWQGQERKAFYAARKVGTHTLWFAPASERPAGGESFEDLMQRVAPTIERLNAEHRGRNIVAVTHGGTIRAAVGFALGLPAQASLSFSVENCSLTRLDHLIGGGGNGLWRVVSVNHRPWSRTLTADHFQQTPIGIDKA